MASTVWKGFISFGLVSFPIRLHTAARSKTLPFHMLHKKDLSRVKEVLYCREEERPLERNEIVKGYEVAKDEYVVVDDSELKKIAPRTAKVMEILQFVKASEVDPVLFDKSYYVAPDETVTRPYALLLEAMKQTKFYGVAKVSMHNREHVVILRPSNWGMMLHTMFYKDEVRQVDSGDVSKPQFKPKEMELATRLIETLAAKFTHDDFRDEYQANVERLIEQKQKGVKVRAISQPRVAPVVDLMAALQKSLKQGGSARKQESQKKVGQRTKRKAA